MAYSLTEQPCGIWINNKVLYRKVFIYTSDQFTDSVPHQIQNIDEVIRSYGFVISKSSDDCISRWLPFAYNLNGDSNTEWYGAVMAGKTRIKIQIGQNLASYAEKLYVIIEYTKQQTDY